MKAVLLHEHGAIENLKYEDFPTPEPKSNEVLVKIQGVALNHLDLFVRKGLPGLKLEMPHILGSDISGTINELGSAVSELHLTEGQNVVIDPGIYCGTCEFCCQGQHSLCNTYGILGEHKRGGYAEYIAIPAPLVIPIPKSSPISPLHAAAVPLTFMTAYHMLMDRAKIKLGEDVLITGISGGVALAALQIAKTVGARTFVTSSSDEKLKQAKDLGADFLINYNTTPDYHKEVFKMTHKRGVDIVIDSAGQDTWKKSIRSLRKGGRLVTCGATTGPIAETNINLLFWKQFDLLGSTMGTRGDLNAVLELVWKGRLKPVIDRVLPLREAQDAHRLLEKGDHFGKIILQP
ncbi:alcohol dehydrogenase [Candidatus Heimdallarchaeota archaeon B3_Heim]|nr:MAG: alcohol dehydrogenase [Candidatus Heimdallarchaeota archaeon B3_Heim]